MNDIYLILLYATRIPPHLLISINGKTFTLSVRGATVDGDLAALLALIRRKNIETVFIRLRMPPVFTMKKLMDEIRSCTLAYPRADIGIATCLTPIKDFCHSIYDMETRNVNLLFDLLPKLQERNAMRDCYQLNLKAHLTPTHPIQRIPYGAGASGSAPLVMEPVYFNGQKKTLLTNTFEIKTYKVNDVYEAIRSSSLAMTT